MIRAGGSSNTNGLLRESSAPPKKPLDAVFNTVHGREHQGEAVAVGQQTVDDEQIELAELQPGLGAQKVRHMLNPVALLSEPAGKEVGDSAVVFDEQDLHEGLR